MGNSDTGNTKLAKLQQRIAELEEIEKKHKIILELLRETGEMARVGGWEIDLETNNVFWTESTKLIHEVPEDYSPELSTALSFFPKGAREKIQKAIEEAIMDGKSYNLELPFVSATGNKLWVVTHGKPHMDNGKCVRLNGTFQDITQRKKEEEKLKSTNQQLIAQEQQLMAGNQQLAALNQQLISGEQQLRAANQQLAANEQQLRAANQQLEASEKELIKNNETLKKYLDVAAEIVVSLDEAGNIKLLNQSGHRILGYNPGELMGENWFSTCLLKEERENVTAFFAKLKNKDNEDSFSFENEIITKSGERKIILWHNTIFRDENGNFTGTLSSGEDITLRKHAEIEVKQARDEARKSEERYRRAQEIGHIGSWEYNLETNEYWGSDEGKRIYNLDLDKTGFPAEEVMGIVVEKDREKVIRSMIDLVNNNEPYDIIFEIIPKNRSEIKIIRSIAELQRDETGKPVKVTGVLHDITFQKTIEKELIRSKEKAEEADLLKSAFLANMSHEIRTPMNGIIGFLGLLDSKDLDDQTRKQYIELANKSGQRLLDTINDIIEVSKIEAGEQELKESVVDMSEILNYHADFFDPQAKEKGIKLFISEQVHAIDAFVATDKNKLTSILTNLIRNAIKFTNQGSVQLGNYIDNDSLVFYVKDTGCGIAADRTTAIFERFIQADSSISRAHEGSGLGLTIAKAYANLLGGEIWVESAVNKGSTFYFSIPYNLKPKESKVPSEHNSSPDKYSNKTIILVAEDDDTSYLYLKIILKKKNIIPIRAVNGKEAVLTFRQNSDISLILMDIKMPEMDGFEATKEIRRFNRSIPIIAQTAYALSDDEEKVKQAGCTDYIAKPINPEKLFSILDKYFMQSDIVSTSNSGNTMYS